MHSFYAQIIRSFLDDINMGFPYFSIIVSIAKLFIVQLVSNVKLVQLVLTSNFKLATNL